VIDRDNMGKFHRDGDALAGIIHMHGGGYGAIAYWNGRAYFAASDDSLRGYSITNAQLTQALASSRKFENPGATPSVSGDGKKNGIVWAVSTKT